MPRYCFSCNQSLYKTFYQLFFDLFPLKPFHLSLKNWLGKLICQLLGFCGQTMTSMTWSEWSLSLFRCEEFLRSQEHIDLDLPPAQLWEHQWEQFLTEYYSLTQGGAKIQVTTLSLPSSLELEQNFDLQTFKTTQTKTMQNSIRKISFKYFHFATWTAWNLHLRVKHQTVFPSQRKLWAPVISGGEEI